MHKRILLSMLVALWTCVVFSQSYQMPYHIGYTAGQQQVSIDVGGTPTDVDIKIVGGQVMNDALLSNDGEAIQLGFPYPRLYFTQTFADNFFVSKGYFPDVIQLRWEQISDRTDIDKFLVYRKPLGSKGDSLLVATIPADQFSFRDEFVEGSKVYKYTVFAKGILNDFRIPLINLVEETGFAFPVGTATGQVTFAGGTAVPDVSVVAEAEGRLKGKSIFLDADSLAYLRYFPQPQDDELKLNDKGFTFQIWTRYEMSGNERGVLMSRGGDIDLSYDGLDLRFKVGSEEATLRYENPVDSFFHVSAVYNQEENYIAMYATSHHGWVDSVRVDAGTAPNVPSGAPILVGKNRTRTQHFYTGYVDEIRVWNRPLTYNEVHGNATRYISGREEGLSAYWGISVGVSNEFYDFSREGGFSFNENHGQVFRGQWTDVIPLTSQLAYRGVTDRRGNYSINGFPFETEGSQYTFTAIRDNHSFEPAQQFRHVGNGELIFNGMDFTDVSSFPVSGTVLYNNMPFPVEGSSILVDGVVATTEEGAPIRTDANGEFTVDVPIGFHSIKLEMVGHVFEGDGRFPPLDSGSQEVVKFNFQEPLSGMVFQDNTLAKVTGRVVGGPVEAAKPMGFGLSKNNIGNATIRLSPKKIADLTFVEADSSVTITEDKFVSESSFNVRNITVHPDPETGEYSVMLPPEEYVVTDISTTNYEFDDSFNSSINVAVDLNDQEQEILNDTIFVVVESDTIIANLPFQPLDYDTILHVSRFDTTFTIAVDTFKFDHRKDFIFRVAPQIKVTNLDGESVFGDSIFVFTDENLGITDTIPLYTREGETVNYTLGQPVYTQRKSYPMKIRLFEEYVDEDSAFNQVPVVDGEIAIINSLAIDDEEERIDLDSRGEARYTFIAGLPNISVDENNPANSYTKVFDMTAFSGENGAIITPWRTDNPFRGFVFGGMPTGNNFVTTGPNEIVTILRDPPGSGSSAFIEQGTSTSSVSSWSLGGSLGRSVNLTTSIGTSVTTFTGGGVGVIVGTISEAESLVDVETGISVETSFAQENTTITTTDFSKTIATSDSENFVGADGDVFVGFSTNIVYGKARNLELIPVGNCADESCIDIGVEGYRLGVADGLRLNPEFETFFTFSQFHIENVLLPSLRSIRNNILTFSENPESVNPVSEPVYVSLVPQDDERFGSDNFDEDIWGDEAKTAIGEGPSYVIRVPQSFIDEEKAVNDTILFYNQQINEWEYWLAHNERVKLESKPDRNVSFDGGVTVEESHEVTTVEETTREFNFVLSSSASVTAGTETSLFGVGVGFELSTETTGEFSSSVTTVDTEEKSTTYGFTLEDGDLGDSYTVDVKEPNDGFGPVFLTKGGATSCPYEGTLLTKYYEPGTELSAATAQREVPSLEVENPVVNDVPENRNATYTLLVRNNSETGEGFEMEIDAVDGTNPDGAVLKIDGIPLGNGLVFNVPAGQTLTKTLTIGKGQVDVNDYENIGIVLRSLCQADPNDNLEDIEDVVTVSAFFQPGCSDVTMSSPVQNWVLNSRSAVTEVLPVTVADYDLNQESFQRVDIQYRAASSSVWINDMSFYNSNQITEDEFAEMDEPKTMITGNEINYSFDMGSLPDREYEVRAVARCVLGPASEVSTPTETMRGTKDTKRPQVFGTPQPADGVLSANDEISIRFDEPIEAALLNKANLSIKGVLNNTELTNGVSVNFDGEDDYVKIAGGLDLSGRSFTIFSWFRRASFDEQVVLFSKGNNASDVFEYGFTASNNFFVNVGGERIESSLTFPEGPEKAFENIAVVYDREQNDISAYRNGEFVLEHVPLTKSVSGRGPIVLGKSEVTEDQHFTGNMHELRIWNQTKSLGDVASTVNQSLSGKEIGLAGYWPLDEGHGELGVDKARFRNAIVFADWTVEPKGMAFRFDGQDDVVEISTASTVVISDQTDFSIEFWFKGEPGQSNAVLFSNGKGDGTDTIANPENTWTVGFNAVGNMVINNNGTELQVTDDQENVLDNNWHHFALAMSRRGNLNAYIDSELQASVSSTGFGALVGSNMWIGARGFRTSNVETGFDNHFTGLVDDFRIWNSFRRRNQIALNWNNKLIGDEVGLVAYYPFESFELVNGINILEPTLNDQYINEFGENAGSAEPLGGADFETDDTPNVKLARPVQSVDFSFTINEDEIILSPSNSFAPLIEETILEVSIRTVEDLFENRIASPVSWTTFVDRNQVTWGDEQLVLTKQVNEEMKFTVDLVNSGGTEQSFAIDNLPPWLTASPAIGTISPRSVVKVTFTVNPGLNIGRYEEDLFLSADLGFNEKMSLALTVFGETPEWQVNPEQFQFSMNVVGELSVNNVVSYDENDLVAAFVENEVRGVASVEYVQDLDRFLVFLDVYSNNPVNEEVELRVWDASKGQELRNVTPEIQFNPGDVLGSPKNPIIISTGSTQVQHVSLRQGWNWTSFNVNSPLLEDVDSLMSPLNAVDGDQVKAQSAVDTYSERFGWNGSLTNNGGASTGRMYQIRIGSAGILDLIGDLEDPNREIEILEGWNWIGYLPSFNMSVDEAFNSINPETGDLIKSQFAFAIFDESIGWQGTLQFLEPGRGYMFNSAKDGILTYPENTILNSRSDQRDTHVFNIGEVWPSNTSRYASNMTVVAQLEGVSTDSVIVGAFVGDSFRGGSQPVKVGGETYYFLTIHGDFDGDQLSFILYDFSDESTIQLSSSLDYQVNRAIGTLDNPMILQLDAAELDNSQQVLVYPNPSKDKFYLDIPEQEEDVDVEIVTLQGQVIRSMSAKAGVTNQFDWPENINAGIYFIRILSGNSVESHLIIKE